MIHLRDLSKTFWVDGHANTILHRTTLTIPAGVSVGLLGRNGAGKSSLLQIIAGSMRPTTGYVDRVGSISWPVGFRGGLHGDLTGAQNARFIARLYGRDTDEVVEFIAGFADLGENLYQPFRTYSSGMRARLAFGLSMAIPFDTYLIDEVTAVGDTAFREKSRRMFVSRIENAGAIVVNHSASALAQFCTAGLVLEAGHLTWYDDVNDAIEVHEALMEAEL